MFGLTSNRGASGAGSIVINKPVATVFNFIAVDFLKITKDGRRKYKSWSFYRRHHFNLTAWFDRCALTICNAVNPLLK